MKKIALTLIAMMIAMVSFAQDVLVATLTHDTETSIFYGTNALADALEVADNGDVINLSGGKFQYAIITKAVSIRGTGVDVNNPTTLNEISVDIRGEVEDNLRIEGCVVSAFYVTNPLYNACFVRSNFSEFGSEVYNLVDARFINCKVSNLYLDSSSADFYNCYLDNYYAYDNSRSSMVNCVLNNSTSGLNNCTILNSAINGYWNGAYIPATAYVSNCLIMGENKENALQNMTTTQNNYFADIDVFTDSDLEKDLTSIVKGRYLGTDDTPVGMFGGAYPYKAAPSYPRFKTFNVDAKVSEEGKLNVTIDISNPQ